MMPARKIVHAGLQRAIQEPDHCAFTISFRINGEHAEPLYGCGCQAGANLFSGLVVRRVWPEPSAFMT